MQGPSLSLDPPYYQGELLRPVIYQNQTFYWFANNFSKWSIGKNMTHGFVNLLVETKPSFFKGRRFKILDYKGITFPPCNKDFQKEVTTALKTMLEIYWAKNFAENTLRDPNFLNGKDKIVIDSDPIVHEIEKA